MHMVTAHMSFMWLWSMTVRHVPREASEKIVSPTLFHSNSRLPTRSRRKIATRMNIVFTKPTAMLVRSFLLEEVIPTFLKMQRL